MGLKGAKRLVVRKLKSKGCGRKVGSEISEVAPWRFQPGKSKCSCRYM